MIFIMIINVKPRGTTNSGITGNDESHVSSMLDLRFMWSRWETFWQSDFLPYGQDGTNQAVFLIAALLLNVVDGRDYPNFSRSPLGAPHYIDLAPAPFFTETYPANVFAVNSNVAVLFNLRWLLLATWVTSIVLLVHCPLSVLTKLCVFVTTSIYVYLDALTMSFIGASHIFLTMAWAMAGLAVSVCNGDDGS